ncbi:MAG: aldolase/citrate lyase family protein [Gammaproteobacteria bacterium]|nr:aldolase/citrate lyase family protein [Gammaproteobacteria bacterium]MDH5305389.1 aldolase/citrate lyase family protein [Gammaproteobacteria bacterium]MDH5323527.1 aldolase/citrate lyase family protein [Gammaproteobacteria bacterium]
MNKPDRLNGVIRAWEEGRPAFACFAKAGRETAIDLSDSPYDGIIFEMEHNPWDVVGLQDSLQYLLNRRQIASTASLAPRVTPLVRIPSNGVEKNQAFAKQALDRGVYGVVWPHINDVEQARNAVAACRYPRPESAPLYAPAGTRGDGPASACRYWGLSQQDYYANADVWPLATQGEILVFLMIESVRGIANLEQILSEVPGIGCVLIGEGDLSQELGFPRDYDHPMVRDAMAQIVATCHKHTVPVGHPHVTSANLERLLAEGYRFLMSAPVRSYGVVGKGRGSYSGE